MPISPGYTGQSLEESGPRARPMESGWVRSIREQCEDQGVAFFLNNGGEHAKNKPAVNSTVVPGRYASHYGHHTGGRRRAAPVKLLHDTDSEMSIEKQLKMFDLPDGIDEPTSVYFVFEPFSALVDPTQGATDQPLSVLFRSHHQTRRLHRGFAGLKNLIYPQAGRQN